MSESQQAPSMSVLKFAITQVLSKFNIDMSGLGESQRLPIETFIKIIYHLFLVIDPADCKRRFRSIYPARNYQEESHFLEQAIIFINSKKLLSRQPTVMQLRCCGGEQFRRTLGLLVEKAIDVETNNLIRKNGSDPSKLLPGEPFDISHISEPLKCYEEEVANMRLDLEAQSLLLDRIELNVHTKGKILSRAELLAKISHLNNVCNESLDKLNERITKLKLEGFKVNRTFEKLHSLNNSKQLEARRVSEVIREVQESTRSPSGSKAKTSMEQLEEFDANLDKLFTEWEEQVFKLPEVQRSYKYLKEKIPLIKLKPIEF